MKLKADPFSGTMFLTLLAGATLGCIAVVLTTPKTGKELRGSLNSWVKRLKARGGHLGQNDDEEPVAMFI